MEELDYWRLCEELNIVQAALLVVGEDPSVSEYAEGWKLSNRPEGYEAAKIAICGGLKNYIRYEKEYAELEEQTDCLRGDYASAPDMVLENNEYLSSLLNRSIAGTLIPESMIDIDGYDIGFRQGSIDVYNSTVNADSLKQWLRLKGFTTGFFFPEPVGTTDFLDPLNPRYAPKLAAAVKAWQAVTDPGKKAPSRP